MEFSNNGVLYLNERAHLNNYSTITFEADTSFRSETANYGNFNNSGGTLNINGAVENSDKLFESLMGHGSASLGVINLYGDPTGGGTSFTLLSGNTLTGTVMFHYEMGAAGVPYDIDVGAAAVTVLGESGRINHLGDLTSGAVVFADGGVTHIHGDVTVTSAVANRFAVLEDTTVVLEAGGSALAVGELRNRGSIVNEREIILADAADYTATGGVYGTLDNSRGTITVNADSGDGSLYASVVAGNTSIGTINHNGDIAAGISFDAFAAADDGTVNFSGATVGAAGNGVSIAVGGADVVMNSDSAYLAAVNANSIVTDKLTNFSGAVNADINGGTGKQVFQEGASINQDWTVGAAGAEIAGAELEFGYSQNQNLTMNGDIDVTRGVLGFGELATATIATGASITASGASADDNGTVAVNVNGVDASEIITKTELEDYGQLSLLSNGPNFVIDASNVADYTVKSASSSNSKLNFYGVYTIDGVTYDAKNASVTIGDAATPSSLTLANSGAALDAGDTLTLAAGSSLVSKSADARVNLQSGKTAQLDGSVQVLGADYRLTFNGAAVFGDGSEIVTAANASSVGVVDAQSFDFTAGTVNVAFRLQNEDDALDKTILAVDGVTATQDHIDDDWILGSGNFYSPVYDITDYGKVTRIKGRMESFGELVGGDLNVNETNLAGYVDHQDARGRSQVSRYLEAAYLASGGDPALARTALDQLGGEAQAVAVLKGVETLNRSFESRIDRVFAESMHLTFTDMQACAYHETLSCCGGGQTVRCENGGFDYREPAASVWGGYLGSWAEQSRHENIAGYDVTGHGIAIGLNRKRGGLMYGFAGAFMRSDIKVEDIATDFTGDAASVNFHAAYLHESGLYGRVGAGFSYGWNDYDTDMVVGGWRSADYDTYSWNGNFELGFVRSFWDDFNLIVSAGVNFHRYHNDAWTEDVYGADDLYTANWFDENDHDSLDVPLQLRLSRVFARRNYWLVAEGRVGWIYAAKGLRPELAMGFMGGRSRTTMRGARPEDGIALVGFGLTAQFLNNFDLTLNYDFESASRYRNHRLVANAGYTF